uniref:GB1/RHD3-type G domain-containing protein n=1 Tax=Parascaris equorum TaxID=6256 RepID=A0A914RZE8_PAREQ
MSFDLTAPFQVEFSTRDQMDHRHKVHPVQIFAPHSSDPNRFKFSENALHSVLGHVAIANKKNGILLDWLTDDTQLQGFHWRSGAKRDTTGIWMWGEPIMIESANGESYA